MVSIVDLYNCVVSKVMQVASFFDGFVHDQLCTVWNHEVLLEDTEQFTLTVTIIWVKEKSQVAAISVLSKLIPSSMIEESTESKSNKRKRFLVSICNQELHRYRKSRCQCKCANGTCTAGFERTTNQFWSVNQAFGIVSCWLFLRTCWKKTEVVVQTNTVTVQTKCSRIESIKQAAKRPKPPLPSDGSNSTSSISINSLPASASSFNFVIKTKVNQVVWQEFTNQELSWDVVNFFLPVLTGFGY